ncbi:MAG TPA: Bax inhibitor-1/YccA family protein [Methylomirabilota bacterium]|jgi:FtsH-binding integral membrane protein|nr:Bax inhibitor-1/YccA family protein [Methylomirabilota bacterium]
MQNRSLPSQLGVRPAPELANQFLVQSFGWMFAGLLLTAAISTVVATNPTLIDAVAGSWILFLFAQLGLGIGIQALMPRLSATFALGLFFVFAATMGVTVGVIVSFYTVPSVITSFFGASAMFGAAAIYGATTKRSLNSIGGFLFMGMIGLLVASVVNIWLASSAAGWVIALIGVVIFTVYTAYDVQKISYGDYAASLGSVEKASVLGAIHLYINFVNIFLFLLRLTGGRR